MKHKKENKKNFWVNTKNKLTTFRKTSIKKIKSDVEKNSRIFFATAKTISEEIVIDHTISQSETAMAKKKAKNKKIFNVLFFIFNLILIVAVFYNFAIEQGGVQPLSSLFSTTS